MATTWKDRQRTLTAKLGGRWDWQTFGPDGIYGSDGGGRTVIVTCATWEDGQEWLHASVARTDRLPSYHDLTALHAALWPSGFAYQIFASDARHVSIHDRALHLWGREDGANLLPDFGIAGTI